MAATGKTPILLYGSTTASNVPVAGNLTNSSDGCEIAINVADKNLFFKDSTNAVNTVPIRQSSASSNGWLSSTDWSTFNSKQPAGTYVTSVTGTAPVVSSGGTTPAISMAAATGSVNGYLTSTDWTTFNSKQAALVSGTNIKTVSGTTLLGSGDLGIIGTGYGGTGLTSFTANGLVYASSTSALTTGSALTYSSGALQVNAAGAYLKAYVTSGSVSIFGDGPTLVSGAGASDSAIRWDGASSNLLFSFGSTRKAYLTNGGSFALDSGFYKTINGSATGYFGDGVSLVSGAGASDSAVRFDGSNLLFSSGSTKLAQLASGGDFTLTSGNLVIGTSGKGIDFSATAGTGTSELLADYEEGTWTPVPNPASGSITSYTSEGYYTKTGRQVSVTFRVTITNVGTATDISTISGLPYANGFNATAGCGREAAVTGNMWQYLIANAATSASAYSYNNNSSIATNYVLYGSITYFN